MGSGNSKKQKTSIKASVKEALKTLVDDEENDVMIKMESADPMGLTKEIQAMSAESLESGPNHQTGTHDESRQEQ
jgi:hypothetical protein